MQNLNLENVSFLLVDDNQYMRTLIKTILATFRCKEISEAADGADAFKMMSSGFNPDIIITNWNMPTLDGLEFVRLVRTAQDSANPFVPIIMVTGFSEHHRIVAARDAGVTEFLVKPISAKVLYSRIVNVVQKPRPFVRAKFYFGPDRRRTVSTRYRGPERRANSIGEMKRAPSLSESEIGRLLNP
jgi:CheY-like chemotaxis protein